MSWTDSRCTRLAVRPRETGHASQLHLAAVQVSDAAQSASASAAHQLEAEQTHVAASSAEGGQALAAAADAGHAAGQGAADSAAEGSAQEAAKQVDAAEQSPSLAAQVRLEGWSQPARLFAKRLHTAGPGPGLKCVLLFGETLRLQRAEPALADCPAFAAQLP